MKKLAQGLSLVLLLVMLPGLCGSALASEPIAVDTASYRITAPAGSHQYEIYQIFAGEKSASGGMSRLQWGVNSRRGDAAVGTAVGQAVLDELEAASGTDREKLAVIAKYVDLGSAAVCTLTDGQSVHVPGGYYLIRDAADSLSGSEAYTQYIVELLDHDMTIIPKVSTPTSELKLEDINDTFEEYFSGLADSADYEIGDCIPLHMTAVFPAATRWDDFETYTLSFVLTVSMGLQCQDDSMYLEAYNYSSASWNTVELAMDYESAGDDGIFAYGTTYVWRIDDLKSTELMDSAYRMENGSPADLRLRLSCNAYLNDGAHIGAAGNPLMMHIEYSNDPNRAYSLGSTPNDMNTVFTYEAVFHNVNNRNDPLSGADFKLEKFVRFDNYGKETLNFDGTDYRGDWFDVTTLGGEDGYYPRKTVEDNDSAEKSDFIFSGLDDGYYRLTETKTPEGWNAVDPIEFRISAVHDAQSDDPQLTSLRGEGERFTLTPDPAVGTLTANIVNNRGSILPGTGGVGTTILYVCGSVLVIAAAVYFLIRRKMDAE